MELKDGPGLGPCCWEDVIGAPACLSNELVRLVEHAERSTARTGESSGTRQLTIVPTGASGAAKKRWFSRTWASFVGGPELRPSPNLQGWGTRTTRARLV